WYGADRSIRPPSCCPLKERCMDLSALLPTVEQAVRLDRLRRRISENRSLLLGVSDGAKAVVVAAVAARFPRPALVVTAKPQQAEALCEELEAWLGKEAGRVLVFPERESVPYERLGPDA